MLNREMKSESGLSLAIASQPFQISLSEYLDQIKRRLFNANPKHFDEVWVIQGLHHLKIKI